MYIYRRIRSYGARPIGHRARVTRGRLHHGTVDRRRSVTERMRRFERDSPSASLSAAAAAAATLLKCDATTVNDMIDVVRFARLKENNGDGK